MAAYRLGYARHLFIHIPKNAGVSIHKAQALRGRLIRPDYWCLRDAAYRQGLRSLSEAEGHPGGTAHARWRDLRVDVREALSAVAIIRNPWARVVSRFRYRLNYYEINPAAYPDGPPDDFDAFLEERHRDGAKPYYWHRAIRGWSPQSDYVTDEAGALRAAMLRFEMLDADTSAYFGLAAPVRKHNVTRAKSSGQPWQSFYDARRTQIVADWYAADIDRFGFDFDSAATRNIWADRAVTLTPSRW